MHLDHRPDRSPGNRRPGRPTPPWLRETRAERAPVRPRPGDGRPNGREPADPRTAWGTPDSETGWAAQARGAEDRPRPGGPVAGDSWADGSRPRDPRDGPLRGHAKPRPPLRKAVMVSGALGGALVLAVALVAVLASKSPSGSGQAAGFTRSS